MPRTRPTRRPTRPTRPLLSALLLGAFACAPPPASAHPQGRHADYVVDVLNARGKRLPSYHHGGQTFVLGRYGQRYSVRVRNQTGRRVEAVVTVDGRDVISGSEGDYTAQRGYVIDPHGSVEIDGFRRSTETVAAFRFTQPSDAYSSRMGTPQHVGVIGVALFRERARRHVHRTRRAPRPYPSERAAAPRRESPDDGYDGYAGGGELRKRKGSGARGRSAAPPASAAPRAAAAAAESAAPADADSYGGLGDMASEGAGARRDNLGTRYGEDLDSQVHGVRFRRESPSQPSAVISLRYDDRRGLVSRGIELYPRRQAPVARRPEPNPFPYNRFAPPPPR